MRPILSALRQEQAWNDYLSAPPPRRKIWGSLDARRSRTHAATANDQRVDADNLSEWR